MASFGRLALFVVGGLVVLAYFAQDKDNTAVTTPAAPSCKNDWHHCIDNTELVNNFEHISRMRINCRDDANKLTKYGDPKWPSYSYFGSYVSNEHFLPSKRITLIEKDAQFQNGFGAYQHMSVRCVYDLEGDKVVSVNLMERQEVSGK